MTMIMIDTDIEKVVREFAESTGRSVDHVLREALLRGLEDMEDLAKADAVMERLQRGEEQTYPLEEVIQRLGLDDQTDHRRRA